MRKLLYACRKLEGERKGARNFLIGQLWKEILIYHLFKRMSIIFNWPKIIRKEDLCMGKIRVPAVC